MEMVTSSPPANRRVPPQAITFGNTKDKKSEVVKKASDEARSYIALHVLNTRPAITYLAQVKRDEGGNHG